MQAHVKTVKVGVLDDFQDAYRQFADWSSLAEAVDVTVFRDHPRTIDEMVERLEPFEVLFVIRERTAFTRELVERLPRLRLIVTAGRQNRSMDLDAIRARGITVAGTPGDGTHAIEIAWALILDVTRRIVSEQAALRSGAWQKEPGFALKGSTLGLVGLGLLGSRMAAVGQAFGMDVIAWSPNLTDERASAAGARLVSKAELFEQAKVISLHLVLAATTRGIVGRDELNAMQRDAVLINTSRAGLVDQAALVDALTSGRIAGAGLDVFDTEPLDEGDPILSAPNTVLTPHLGYCTAQNYRTYFTGAAAAIEAWLAGRPLPLPIA